ncbi:MAG: hypothetical protein KatS3mg076_0036 [Candidatus Binatia bacterium]|nr:MAG: hypothetical protein KatS3mg076_0036 [Candidatus Binatia bacterium]
MPVVIEEKGTSLVRGWLEEDPHIATWAMTRLEIASALDRRYRQGLLSFADRTRALARFAALFRAWDEVVDVVPVVERALALLGRHSLRAADAAQLAAASLLAEDDPASLRFACLDRRLAQAAHAEGFTVLTWPAA